MRPAPALAPPPGLDRLDALLRYDDAARAFVTAVKYRNARASIDGLAGAVAALVVDGRSTIDVVTWAPTTPERLRSRGYDQAELLARAIGRQLRLPVRRSLRRIPGPHQTGRPAHLRRRGPQFVALGRAGTSVLVVDDVCTTGTTLSAAGATLRRAGARQVRGLVMARTPRSGVHR
ncbi:MAG TPA: phosphoribosyltransferase family protein [Acidimicrobiales bacterium]